MRNETNKFLRFYGEGKVFVLIVIGRFGNSLK